MSLIAHTVHLLSKTLIFILGIKIKVKGKRELLKSRGVFFVSNHLSYLDGVTISSLSPLVFIGRVDMKRWPLFGTLTFLSNTIFVNRMNPSAIHNELGKIEHFLSNNINVILFPEGTSTDGSTLLPFKTSFFKAPLDAGCRIVPLVVRYSAVDAQPLSDKNKDLVYWYGDMDFFPHLLGVCKLKRVELEVTVCEAIASPNAHPSKTPFPRKELGNVCREVIQQHLSSTAPNLLGK